MQKSEQDVQVRPTHVEVHRDDAFAPARQQQADVRSHDALAHPTLARPD